MAAQLTRITSSPNWSWAICTVRNTASELLTSHWIATLLHPCAWRSLDTLPAACALISTHATAQPACAKARAVASPRPLPAPVTRTAFPSRPVISICTLLIYDFSMSAESHYLSSRLFHGPVLVFLNQFAKEFGGVAPAVDYGGGQTEMIGAARQNAAATICPYEHELRDNLFPRVLGRQSIPPGKSADIDQFGAVIQDISATHPGNFVAHNTAALHELLLQVKRISRVIDQVPVPGDR